MHVVTIATGLCSANPTNASEALSLVAKQLIPFGQLAAGVHCKPPDLAFAVRAIVVDTEQAGAIS